MGRRVRRGRKLWKQNENVSCKRQQSARARSERASEGTRREIRRLPEVSGSAPVSPV